MHYAQLEVLKIQLEPHFLFNTLNSIAALARNDGLAAENMTLQLADLLRFSLDAVGVHEVPLSRELTFLQKYIDIQQTRFQDRLLVEMDIQPHTLWCAGAEPAAAAAGGKRHPPRHRPAQCSWLHSHLHPPGLRRAVDGDQRQRPGTHRVRRRVPPEGVGLQNTRARLQQLYNHDHKLTLEDAPGGGCIVKIHIPFRECSQEVNSTNAHSSVA